MGATLIFGALLDPDLQTVVFGAPCVGRHAELSGMVLTAGAAFAPHGTRSVRDGRIIGQQVQLTAEASERLATCSGLWGWKETSVALDDGSEAGAWLGGGSNDPPATEFDPLVPLLADEILTMLDHFLVEDVAHRLPQLAVRAQARLNARGSAPTDLRRHALPEDVTAAGRRVPYASFFSIEEYDLSHRTFDGGWIGPMTRAVFISGDAVVVLPYDPVRDCVLLVEQFRAGPYARGDAQPWLLEAIAGRIDGGETAEGAAYREAKEEAGVTLQRLLSIGGHYPSPGAKAEYLYSYLAIADLPDEAAGLGGLECEQEDIRTHIVGFDRVMRMVENGEIQNGPLLVCVFQLARCRSALRAEAGLKAQAAT